jgi:hypothetical protein
MGFFARLIRKKNKNLACYRTGDCPYEYDKDSDRDIEGMPFVDGDPRSCPQYGHICPEFMEDFGLTVDDLNIRATIHCGSLIDHLIDQGQADAESAPVKALKQRYEELTKQYPADKFPQYY